MKIRRERLHQCGLTNLDYKTMGDQDNIDRYHPTLKYADFGTMGKSQYKRLNSVTDPKEHLKVTSGWKTMSNITTTPAALYNPAKYETTAEFYQTKGKKAKQPAQIGKRRDTELEKPYWNDNVFTGDNPVTNALLSEGVRDRNSTFGTDAKKTHHDSKPAGHKSSSVGFPSKKENLTKTTDSALKHRQDLNADAENETQLVHLENKVTQEGQVNLVKV